MPADICPATLLLYPATLPPPGRTLAVPADMVLLRTAEASGVVFLRTDQLDGETDWKVRPATLLPCYPATLLPRTDQLDGETDWKVRLV